MSGRPSKPWYRAAKNTWYITHKGRKISLGVHGRENRKEAEEAWHRLVVEGGKEILTFSPRNQVVQSALTCQEMADRFLTDRGPSLRPPTLSLYKTYLLLFCQVHGPKAVADLTPSLLGSFVNRPTWSVATRSVVLAIIRAAVRWALVNRVISVNPLLGLKTQTCPSRGERCTWAEEDYHKVLGVADSAFRNYLTVLWETGARPGEVAALTAQDIDWNRSQAVIKAHKTTRWGHRRVIYLSPLALAVLGQFRTLEGPLLRNSRGGPWTQTALRARLSWACRKAGVPLKCLYGFRHTFATEALVKGVPDAVVAELMGHRGTQTLHHHYSHLMGRGDLLLQALDRVRSAQPLEGASLTSLPVLDHPQT
jgi:integrase